MKYLKIKDKKYRNQFKAFELKNLILKCTYISLINNYKYKKYKELILINFLKKQKKYKFVKNKIIRRCIETNRGRGTFQSFGLSRTILREYMSFGIIPGYNKAVW